MTCTFLTLSIPRPRSEAARQVLQRICWRGYVPPAAGDAAEVIWQLPGDQVDLIRSVLYRNRRLAGASPTRWASIERVCEAIATEAETCRCWHAARADHG